jgi:hypothetical protein
MNSEDKINIEKAWDFELYMPYFGMCWYMLTKAWNVALSTPFDNCNANNYHCILNNIR